MIFLNGDCFKLMSKIWPGGLLPGEHSNAASHIPAGAKSFVENKDAKQKL